MSDLGPLLIASVGVVGTLLSPVVTTRLSARLQRDQFDAQRALALDTHRQDGLRAQHAEKRACYVTLNAASRRYRVVQMNYLYAVEDGRLDDEDRRELEESRRAHGAAVAEAQMTAAPKVLDELETISGALSRSYRRIRRLESGQPEPDGSFDEVRAELLALWDEWKGLRDAMRLDLGVDRP
ncbi:hypothetical protein OG871_34455 [Kitasatospora sp. NBC_00374]|uniref:hypothetical protein n=1 Tax=Kitasatospora sp. NBC_00374 TaxID=2975964 RepID=UPI0030E32FBF